MELYGIPACFKYFRIKNFKIKYKRVNADASQFNFLKMTLGSTGENGTINIATINNNEWNTVTLDLSIASFSSSTTWTDKNIRQFRLYPWADETGDKILVKCFISNMTQAEADAYFGPAEQAALTIVVQ